MKTNGRTARAGRVHHPRSSPDQPEPIREIDWHEPAHAAKLGTATHATFIGEFQSARKLSGPTAIKDSDIFRVGLTRLRLGGAKEERVATAAAAAIAKAK